jgi:DNA-binding PadR family transcriptional regulator
MLLSARRSERCPREEARYHMAGHLGELEQLLLLGLLRRGGEASGIDLREELQDRTGRRVLPGAVYNIMERLLERDLVEVFFGDEVPERGGRRRKHYRITPAGERTLADSYRQIERMADGLAERLRRLAAES